MSWEHWPISSIQKRNSPAQRAEICQIWGIPLVDRFNLLVWPGRDAVSWCSVQISWVSPEKQRKILLNWLRVKNINLMDTVRKTERKLLNGKMRIYWIQLGAKRRDLSNWTDAARGPIIGVTQHPFWNLRVVAFIMSIWPPPPKTILVLRIIPARCFLNEHFRNRWFCVFWFWENQYGFGGWGSNAHYKSNYPNQKKCVVFHMCGGFRPW